MTGLRWSPSQICPIYISVPIYILRTPTVCISVIRQKWETLLLYWWHALLIQMTAANGLEMPRSLIGGWTGSSLGSQARALTCNFSWKTYRKMKFEKLLVRWNAHLTLNWTLTQTKCLLNITNIQALQHPILGVLRRNTAIYITLKHHPFSANYTMYTWELHSNHGTRMSAVIISAKEVRKIITLSSRGKWPNSVISKSDHSPDETLSVFFS